MNILTEELYKKYRDKLNDMQDELRTAFNCVDPDRVKAVMVCSAMTEEEVDADLNGSLISIHNGPVGIKVYKNPDNTRMMFFTAEDYVHDKNNAPLNVHTWKMQSVYDDGNMVVLVPYPLEKICGTLKYVTLSELIANVLYFKTQSEITSMEKTAIWDKLETIADTLNIITDDMNYPCYSSDEENA